MNRDQVTMFRDKAAELGLATDFANNDGFVNYFAFDLNQGGMASVGRDAAEIMKLVELARDYASDDGYGEHNALLQLVAPRADLKKNTGSVYWSRPYHVDARENPTKWISLKDWLIENGQDPSSVIREKPQS